jgi:hypothetical protein
MYYESTQVSDDEARGVKAMVRRQGHEDSSPVPKKKRI